MSVLDQIDVNQFIFCKLDPEVPPDRIEVATWSDVFRAGGSVDIDAYIGDRRITLKSLKVKENRSVRRERGTLSALLDEWNKDAANNWRTVVVNAKASVVAYLVEQAEDYGVAAEVAERLAPSETEDV